MFLSQKPEFVEYNACLVITGAIRGSQRDTLYQKLGLDLLNIVAGIGSCVASTEYTRTNNLFTF